MLQIAKISSVHFLCVFLFLYVKCLCCLYSTVYLSLKSHDYVVLTVSEVPLHNRWMHHKMQHEHEEPLVTALSGVTLRIMVFI